MLLVIIGWSVGWWVRNAVFSEKARRIFLIFCMKSGEAYKGTEPDFWEKFKLLWRYSLKGLQLSRKSDNLIFFSKTAVTIFLVFGLWCKFEKMANNLNLRNFLTVDSWQFAVIYLQIAIFFLKNWFHSNWRSYLVFRKLNTTNYSEKNLQFGDIWPRNCQKIAQIEVFGHFLEFT